MAEDNQTRTKCFKAVRIMNIISAVVIVGFGLAGIIFMVISDLLSGKFFLVFSPIFMIIFGLVVFAAQFKVKRIMRYFGFLQTLLGRGIFNIYLSSVVFYFFSCDANSVVVGWILAMIMFGLGLVYLFFHCYGKPEEKRQLGENVEEN